MGMKKLFPVFLLACCAALLWICAARAETETVLRKARPSAADVRRFRTRPA